MKIVISGATGFIGNALSESLAADGHSLVIVSRKPESAQKQMGPVFDYLSWKEAPEKLPEIFKDTAVVVNLAGAGVADGRWSSSYKKVILNSRLDSTNTLKTAVLASKNKNLVFIQASAIGYYGSRADEELDEKSGSGKGFLADVVRQWEAEAEPLTNHCRLSYLRTGVVLGRGEGMLGKLLPQYKLFAGGAPGDGSNWLSWIHIEDVVSAIRFIIENKSASGHFNLVAPNPEQMKTFSKILAEQLNRPDWLPVPEMMLKLMLGEMAEETILASQKARPANLLKAGYSFKFENLAAALKDLLEES